MRPFPIAHERPVRRTPSARISPAQTMLGCDTRRAHRSADAHRALDGEPRPIAYQGGSSHTFNPTSVADTETSWHLSTDSRIFRRWVRIQGTSSEYSRRSRNPRANTTDEISNLGRPRIAPLSRFPLKRSKRSRQRHYIKRSSHLLHQAVRGKCQVAVTQDSWPMEL